MASALYSLRTLSTAHMAKSRLQARYISFHHPHRAVHTRAQELPQQQLLRRGKPSRVPSHHNPLHPTTTNRSGSINSSGLQPRHQNPRAQYSLVVDGWSRTPRPHMVYIRRFIEACIRQVQLQHHHITDPGSAPLSSIRHRSPLVSQPMPTYLNHSGRQSSLCRKASPSVNLPATQSLHLGEFGQLK